MGLGAAIRDDSIMLIAYGVKRIKASWTPLMTEAAAANLGMETDVTEVVRRVNDNAFGCSPVYLFLDNVCHLSKLLDVSLIY